MSIQHFELTGADKSIQFSPYCWRTRMALLHKGLAFETVPWFFSDKSSTASSGTETVPVIRDNDTWVSDSWNIVTYLDDTYPETPALLPNQESLALARLVESTCHTYVYPALFPIVLTQVYEVIPPECQPYFRETREAFFGTTLENITIDEATGKINLAKALSHFDAMFKTQPFLCGESVGYADYVLFGVLKWADVVSRYDVLDKTSLVGVWFDKVDALFDGHGQLAKKARD
ncbi:MAG: glutathione S-transferase N-terminal domain-containing protein [Pseudomonadota bacterium]